MRSTAWNFFDNVLVIHPSKVDVGDIYSWRKGELWCHQVRNAMQLRTPSSNMAVGRLHNVIAIMTTAFRKCVRQAYVKCQMLIACLVDRRPQC